MIRAQVLTIIEFTSDEEFRHYLASDQQAKITGFAGELLIAYASGKPYVIPTPRLEYGMVVTTGITVRDVGDETN